MKYSMLTTKDNPYDPKTDWERWFKFDITNGYNTCGLLDKFAISSEALPKIDQVEAINNAIDQIISSDPENIYKKLTYEED